MYFFLNILFQLKAQNDRDTNTLDAVFEQKQQ